MFMRYRKSNKPLASLALILMAAPAAWGNDGSPAGRVRISDSPTNVQVSASVQDPVTNDPTLVPAVPADVPAAPAPAVAAPAIPPVPDNPAVAPAPAGFYQSTGDRTRGYVYTEYTSRRQACMYGGAGSCDACCRRGRHFDIGWRCQNIALNPAYVDPRDTRFYAAQGYGVPMAVPLAPVVGSAYNYGWGIPSSRLTPLSYPNPY